MRSRLSEQANLKWYKKVWDRDSLPADLEYHTARFEDAISTFNVCHSILGFITVNFFCTHHNQITTLIDISRAVANLPALVQDHATAARLITAGSSVHNPASRDIPESVSSDQSGLHEKVGGIFSFSRSFCLIHKLQFSVIKRTEFDLIDIISQRPGQPSLHRAQYYAPNGRGTSVIVKIYPPRAKSKKNADLRRLVPILSVLCPIHYSTSL
jgi:hypothetical protein